MTVIRPNSVSGITSITAQANEINFFRSNGTLAGLQLNGVNFNTTTGISTFNNLDVGGVLTYQDVTNVDSIGIITARSTIDAQGDVSIADKIIHTGDTNTAIRFPAADTISFETGGSTRAKITSTGNFEMPNDNDYIKIGAGQDLQLVHTGSSSNIVNTTGALQIQSDLIRFDNASGTERARVDSSGNFLVGGTSLGAAGSFGIEPNGHIRSILASGNSGDTLFGAISGVSNGFQINIDSSNNQEYRFFSGTSQAVTIKDNKLGVLIGSPFNRFQCGGHTFTGGDAMYADNRVGMSNHGSLTGLMLASTYNDATHPEYGLVFVQGPTTSSYNVWSVSPDGPAKGDSLNFHYGGYSGSGGRPNIHVPSLKKFEMNGDGNFHITAGNLKFANGYGVDFSATGNSGGTMTSELLHDYEEGTFTPTIIRSSAGYSGNYNYQHGVYTRIGRLVHCYIDVDINNFSGGGGHVGLSGLPYTVSSHGLPGWPHMMQMRRMYLDGDYAAGVDARAVVFSGTNYGYVMNIDDDQWDYGNYSRVIFTGQFTFMVS